MKKRSFEFTSAAAEERFLKRIQQSPQKSSASNAKLAMEAAKKLRQTDFKRIIK